MKPRASLALSLLLAPALGAAQPAARRSALVADLGLHVIGVGYQRTVSDAVSVQIDMEFYSPWTVNDNVLGLGASDWRGSTDLAGIGPRARIFLHPFADAPYGLWVSPFTQYMVVRATRGGTAILGSAFAVGLSAGYAFQATRWLLVSLGVGVQYHQATLGNSTATPGFSLLAPAVDLIVAYTF